MDIAIVGCGFVADFYMQTLSGYPTLRVVAAMDIVAAHAERFRGFWGVPVFTSADDLLASARFDLVLNLTNPNAHYEVSRRFLEAGKHVYSEKPLALTYDDAAALVALAEERGLAIAAAPCNHLGEAAQAAARAIAASRIGVPRVCYAEMDDGYIPITVYRTWRSVSGAPWPYRDEFAVGCTLEHAGYYLTWLLMLFGPIRRVVALASVRHPGKPIDPGATEGADFSVACLEFQGGMVARLTCSILAPHDHSLRIVGDRGVLRVADCWFYRTPVTIRPWLRIRRALRLMPFGRRERLIPTGPATKRLGAAAMDFARGPAELASAVRERRRSRVPADFALHITEAALAIDRGDGSYMMRSSFAALDPITAPIG